MSMKNLFSNKNKKIDAKTVRIGGKKKSKTKSPTRVDSYTNEAFRKDDEIKPLTPLSEPSELNISSEFGLETENFNTSSPTEMTSSGKFGALEITLDPMENIDPFDNVNLKETNNEAEIKSPEKIDVSEFKFDDINSAVDFEIETRDETIRGIDINSAFNPMTKDFDKFDDKTNLSSSNEEYVTSFDELTKSVTKSGATLSAWADATIDEKTSESSRTSTLSSIKDKFTSFFDLPTKYQYGVFFGGMLIGVTLMGTSVYVNQQASDTEAQVVSIGSTFWGESQKLNTSFTQALLGVKGSYSDLVSTWNSMSNYKKELDVLIPQLNSPNISEKYTTITTQYDLVSNNVSYLKSQENILKQGGQQIDDLNTNLNSLKELNDKLGVIYLQYGATQNEISNIYAISSSLDKISSSVTAIITSEKINQEDITTLKQNKEAVGVLLSELKDGNEAKNIRKAPAVAKNTIERFSKEWLDTIPPVFDLIQASDDLKQAKEIGQKNATILASLYKELRTLIIEVPSSDGDAQFVNRYVLTSSLLFLLLSLIGLLVVYIKDKEKLGIEAQKEADKQKAAIFKLINEINPIRDGNLLQKATLEEGVTYDIAKSVNDTIESLASLVRRIKNSSVVMAEKTNQVTDLSHEMLAKTEEQASSIISTGSSVIQISNAINDISNQSKKSLETASESTKAAKLGSEQVKQSVESMVSISDNMSETVALMKKVSDSSIQISEVIDLLSDITEETNILALNATVQAAKAGEAGRGFKIVADSIQQLADNAADATRRVGALIATVQTDIQSVGNAITRTTDEVKRGIERSDNAGKALEEINQISEVLATIVQKVTNDALINAETAKQISKNMERILKVTEDTKSSTEKATASIEEISNISSELNESVQSFIVE